jgi:hypothetical protein
LLASAGVGVLAFGAVAFVAYRSSAEALHRVEMEAAALRAQRDSIRAVANLRDSLRTVITATTDSLRQRTDSLRLSVARIEAGREAAERAVWHLRDSDATERAFREAYPEFAPAMRVTEYQQDPNGPALNYLMLPTNTARSFIVYRLRADSLELVRDSLLLLDTLNVAVIGLKDSVITLTRLNEDAFRIGFDSASAAFERLRADFETLARKPRLGFNVPTLGGMLAALGVGFVVGFVVH